MTEKTVNKAPSGRPNRRPVGYRNRLAVFENDPNYVYRWVNTNISGGDRVNELEEIGYEKVEKSAQRQGNGRIDASPLGKYETTPGGSGDTLILMRQKREYFEEDQRAKQKVVDETDHAQKRINPDGFYGHFSEKSEIVK